MAAVVEPEWWNRARAPPGVMVVGTSGRAASKASMVPVGTEARARFAPDVAEAINLRGRRGFVVGTASRDRLAWRAARHLRNADAP